MIVNGFRQRGQRAASREKKTGRGRREQKKGMGILRNLDKLSTGSDVGNTL